MQQRMPIRWRFIRHADGNWLWQRFGPDGRLDKTSTNHAAYGRVLFSALEHGFRPAEHDYSVDLPYGRLHYPPGRDPEVIQPSSRREPPAPMASAVREDAGLRDPLG